MSYKDKIVEKSKIIPDVLIIKPSLSWDLRGNIYTSYNKDFYEDFLPGGVDFKHDKFAMSKHNVLRGLHGDSKTWKLVSCVYGEIYEVVVDMRKDSTTYLKWDSFLLKGEEYSQILIPPGFVNGYYVVSDHAVFHYKLAYEGVYIDALDQFSINWNNVDLGIKWPCVDPILSDRDIK